MKLRKYEVRLLQNDSGHSVKEMFLHPYINRIPAPLSSILQSSVRIYGAVPHLTDMYKEKNPDLYLGCTRFEFRPVQYLAIVGFFSQVNARLLPPLDFDHFLCNLVQLVTQLSCYHPMT
jgi:hypothetical protein